jgi:tetratricopeptide (TPR) repeat protein
MTALVERSGGNPLFLRALLVATRGGRDVDRLPETVEDLVTAEIDRLPPSVRRILRYAAVLGTTVEERLLRQMLDDPDLPPGPAAFRPLRAFIREAGPGRLSFRHALIRDAAYDGLPYRRRRELHDLVGTRLLEESADPTATPEPLAMHFFHAGRSEEAWTYCRLAGERARAQYAHAEAANFLAWAAESGRRAGAAPAEVSAALEGLGDVEYFMGLTAEASRAYRQALHVSRGDAERQAALLLKEGRLQQRMGNLRQALRRLRQGMRLIEGVGTSQALSLHSRLATRYAIGRLQEGRFRDARSWGTQAVGLAEPSGDLAALADAHSVLEAVSYLSGQATEVSHGELALRLYRESGDLIGEGHCLNNLAVRAVLEGRLLEGQELLHQAAQVFQRVGDEASLAAAVYNQADILIRQGRLTEADTLLRRALHVARSVDDQDLVALAVRESGKWAARAGRYDEARALLADAIERLTEMGEPQEVADARAAVAEAYLLEGRWQEATECVDAVLAGGDAADTLLPTLHRIRGCALLESGDTEEAARCFETGLALCTSPVTRAEEVLLQAGQALLAVRAQSPSAIDQLQRSRQALDELGVVAPPLPGWPPT